MADKIPSDQTDKEKKLLNRAISVIEDVQAQVTTLFKERQTYRDMYHTFDSVLLKKAPWQEKYAHPFPFIAVETLASFFYEGVTGNLAKPLIEIQGLRNEDYASNEVLTKIVKAQMENSNLKNEFYYGVKEFGITGDWFAQVIWDRQERVFQANDQVSLAATEDLLKETFTDIDLGIDRLPGLYETWVDNSELVIEKNQPDIISLNPNHVWRDPKSPGDLEKSRYYILHEFVPLDTIRMQAKEYNLYREENIDMIKMTSRPAMPRAFTDTEQYKGLFREKDRNTQSYTKNAIDEENPVVHLEHIVYTATGEWETIANRRVYLGRSVRFANTRNTLVHIKAFEEKDKVYGQSMLRPIWPQWRLVNKQQNLEADNLMMHMRGYTFVNRDAGANVIEDMQQLRPGSVVVTNNPGAVTHNRPDLPSTNIELHKQNLISQMQQTVGLNEVLQGATPSSNVRSAGQQAQLANFGAKILAQQIRLIGEGFKKLGQKWVTMNYEFLDQEETLPILGSEGREYVTIQPGQFPPTANIHVALAAEFDAKKEVQLQQMLQAINTAAQVPGVNIVKLIKDWFREQGSFTNPDSYFLLDDDTAAALQLQQLGIGGGGQDPALAGQAAPQETVPNPDQQIAGNLQEGL